MSKIVLSIRRTRIKIIIFFFCTQLSGDIRKEQHLYYYIMAHSEHAVVEMFGYYAIQYFNISPICPGSGPAQVSQFV